MLKACSEGNRIEDLCIFRSALVFCPLVISNIESVFPGIEHCHIWPQGLLQQTLRFCVPGTFRDLVYQRFFRDNQAKTNEFCCNPQTFPCNDVAVVDLCWNGAYLAAINSAFCVIVLRPIARYRDLLPDTETYCQVQRPTKLQFLWHLSPLQPVSLTPNLKLPYTGVLISP